MAKQNARILKGFRDYLPEDIEGHVPSEVRRRRQEILRERERQDHRAGHQHTGRNLDAPRELRQPERDGP